MRFLRFCCVVAFCGALIMPVYGASVSKCTALRDNSSSCTFGSGSGLDWRGTCTTAGVSTSLKGIGICAATAGIKANTTSDELSFSSTLDDNKYCWCRLLVPLVSSWVALGQGGRTYTECASACASGCASNLNINSGLKNALLRNIIAD